MKKRILAAICFLLIFLTGCSLLKDLGGYSESIERIPRNTEEAPEPGGNEGAETALTEQESGDFLRRFGYDVLWIGQDAYGVVSSEEGGFSTLVSFPMSQLWEEGTGLYLSMRTADPGVIPYVIVSRNPGVALDGEKYLKEQFLPDMQKTYGENLRRASAAEKVAIGEKQLWQMDFEYDLPDDGVRILMRRICGTIGDSFVIFTAKKTSEDNDAVFTSLEEIVTFYRNGAGAYAAGEVPEEGQTGTQPEGNIQGAGFGDYTVAPAKRLSLNTVKVSNEVFSMEVPENWILTTHKQFSDFGVYLYDPEVPERKIFFYCKMEYFNKSQAEKDYYANLAAIAGVKSFAADIDGYLTSASVPVLNPATTEQFYKVYPEFIQLLYQIQGYTYVYPDLNAVQVLERYRSSAPVTPTSMDNSILRISFTADSGKTCQGLVGGEVSNKLTYMQGSVDLGNYCVYDVMGITAPEEEFAELEPVLLRCLTSFDLTSGYVQKTQQNVADQTDAILAAGRNMQAAYDSYNAAWSNRQTSYDVISQKNSDATLGYERLYDPVSGEVYRAESGFYENYDLHRDEYANRNLKKIDSSS
ncbi:MAG: hypothetical protein J5849_05595, partial [Clostridia bacterium]|nr:hypothetical protein [Clostridia bacterium]